MKADLTIKRILHPKFTLGLLETSSGFLCHTLELPWIDNLPNVSCVPSGTYKAFKRLSPSNGLCIELQDVPKRSHSQIHVGNFTRDVKGCILVGSYVKDLDGDLIPDVANSKNTLEKLLQLLPDAFIVTIS